VYTKLPLLLHVFIITSQIACNNNHSLVEFLVMSNVINFNISLLSIPVSVPLLLLSFFFILQHPPIGGVPTHVHNLLGTKFRADTDYMSPHL